MRRIRSRAGLDGAVIPYALWHVWVTDALAKGVPIETVAELAGHSSTHMIDKVYSHLKERGVLLSGAAKKVRESSDIALAETFADHIEMIQDRLYKTRGLGIDQETKPLYLVLLAVKVPLRYGKIREFATMCVNSCDQSERISREIRESGFDCLRRSPWACFATVQVRASHCMGPGAAS